MSSVRFEMRVPEGLLERLDAARGFESRASFVKRALEKALGEADGHESPASSRAPVEPSPRAMVVPDTPGRMSSDEAARRALAEARGARQRALNKAKGL